MVALIGSIRHPGVAFDLVPDQWHRYLPDTVWWLRLLVLIRANHAALLLPCDAA